jgi:hypothetical protein
LKLLELTLFLLLLAKLVKLFLLFELETVVRRKLILNKGICVLLSFLPARPAPGS